MDCLKMVRNELKRGWTGPNLKCPHGPCHYTGQDCTYCFCPFYPCKDEELGEFIQTSKGGKLWSCLYCHLIHRTPVCKYIASRVEELKISDPEDKRLRNILNEAKERFLVPGKAIMVVGATSDAGKSLTAAALCRIISRKGHSVTPMKAQNMSLNSMVTDDGSEVASIQIMQAKAARIKHPDHNVNPILLKPMKDGITDVFVNGRHFENMDVPSYYGKFVPSKGSEAVRESIRVQKIRYEYVVMEGAGSPAEINIYDHDIANMRAADMADASCILVVNMNMGGGFAYALGTIELLSEKDRKRIKGIIFNNMHGDPSSLKKGIERLESIAGVPVLGVIPHIDIPLPKEDSLTLGSGGGNEKENVRIAVIKLPKMANFTDLDPLYHENVSILYTDDPDEVKKADVIIIPGTKNTFDAMRWMSSSGMDETVKEMKGKVPIIGICGGYQIMSSELSDPLGKENGTPFSMKGLGLFDAVTSWNENSSKVSTVKGILAATEEEIKGYEIRSGATVTNHDPLFVLLPFGGERINEGSSRPDEKLFGTYVHGLFDTSAFRGQILKMTGKYVPGKYSDLDYDDILSGISDELADAFESSLNMELFDKIFMEAEK
ncbi:MAG: cobyric acid synthase [Methanomassiliicoccaceae archaeon]|nr:cobyric acid synthase [Methanomassiliicoccaceae archaeon]